MVPHKSHKLSYSLIIFFFLFALLIGWFPLTCLSISWFFLPVDLVCYWNTLLNISAQLLYSSTLWFVLFNITCLCWNSLYVHTLLSWFWWATQYCLPVKFALNSLPVKSLISVLLTSISIGLHGFVWNMFLCFFIYSLCCFCTLDKIASPSLGKVVSCRWTSSISPTQDPGCLVSNFWLSKMASFFFRAPNSWGCGKTSLKETQRQHLDAGWLWARSSDSIWKCI